MTANKVVIIGGGYGGTLVAKALDDQSEVTLIDPREGFVNAAASLRALTRPEWAHNAFFPYAGLLERGTVIRDRAVSVDPFAVTLESGARVEADYLVLATGSGYAYPAKPTDAATSIDRQLSDLRDTHRELQAAKRVLIIGAGPVGIELAAEIKDVWPDKDVTVLGRGDQLLPGHLGTVQNQLAQSLEQLGVEVRLRTALRSLPAWPPARAGDVTVTTDDGDTVDADIWFAAFGVNPNVDYLQDGRLTELVDGLVPVSERMNVRGYGHVYAVGDIVSLPDPKMASYAMEHAQVVVDNIAAELAGLVPDVTHAISAVRRILVPLGTRTGVGQLPGADGPVSAPADVVFERKGRDLFTARFAQRFDLARPARC